DEGAEPQRHHRGHAHHPRPRVPPDPPARIERRAVHLPRPRQVPVEPRDGAAPAARRREGPPDHLKGSPMPSEKQIQETFERVANDIPGFIAASLVDLDSGMTLGARSVRNDFDLTAASAYNSEMVKQKLKIMKALNLRTTLDDMLITLGDQIHLIKLVT